MTFTIMRKHIFNIYARTIVRGHGVRHGARWQSTLATLGDDLPRANNNSKTRFDIIKTIQQRVRSGEEDAFYVIDLDEVERKHTQWVRELPRVHPFYAVKCNPDVEILKRLVSLGTNFDCASRGEIETVLGLGAAPDQIIYANPCKQVSHLMAAAALGVDWMTFDSAEELEKIATYHPRAKLLLRLKVDDSNSICQFSVKFGADLDESPDLLRLASHLGLQVRGCSFHVGSGCQDAVSYERAVRNCRTVADYAESLGMNFDVVDVGGGFPGVDPAEELEECGDESPTNAVSFAEICSSLRASLDTHFPDGSGVRVIGEPGRYMVASSHTLAVAITGRKAKGPSSLAPYRHLIDLAPTSPGPAQTPENTRFMYYVNDGLYGSFNSVLYDHAVARPRVLPLPDTQLVQLEEVGAVEAGEPQQQGAAPGQELIAGGGGGGQEQEQELSQLFDSSVWGPTCDGLDCLTKSVSLPRLTLGDWLYFNHMGAYTSAAGSEFNGFERPDKVYVGVRVEQPLPQQQQQQQVGRHQFFMPSGVAPSTLQQQARALSTAGCAAAKKD